MMEFIAIDNEGGFNGYNISGMWTSRHTYFTLLNGTNPVVDRCPLVSLNKVSNFNSILVGNLIKLSWSDTSLNEENYLITISHSGVVDKVILPCNSHGYNFIGEFGITYRVSIVSTFDTLVSPAMETTLKMPVIPTTTIPNKKLPMAPDLQY